MKTLQSFCEKIAFICRVRYEVYTSECPNSEEICEQLDESVYQIFYKMKSKFSLHSENIELFQKFFWNCLKETEDWKSSVGNFGKDFDGTKSLFGRMF